MWLSEKKAMPVLRTDPEVSGCYDNGSRWLNTLVFTSLRILVVIGTEAEAEAEAEAPHLEHGACLAIPAICILIDENLINIRCRGIRGHRCS